MTIFADRKQLECNSWSSVILVVGFNARRAQRIGSSEREYQSAMGWQGCGGDGRGGAIPVGGERRTSNVQLSTSNVELIGKSKPPAARGVGQGKMRRQDAEAPRPDKRSTFNFQRSTFNFM